MGVVDPLKSPMSDAMTCSDHFNFNPNPINKYLPKIISYIPLLESST